MAAERKVVCPECGESAGGVSRRAFMKGVGAAAVVASSGVWVAPAGADGPKVAPESLVKRLYDGLNAKQREVVCLPWEHAARTRINANWAVTKPTVEEFFTPDQQQLVRDIFRGVTSEEGYKRFLKQMEEDYGGLSHYHVALFGQPGDKDRFQWVMTGRHMTIRCDGNHEDGTAFGGPIIYGHGTGDSEKGMPGNVFYYQTLRANEVFTMLDGKQRARALLPKSPPEAAVQIHKGSVERPGIPVGELSADQKKLTHKVMHDLLDMYPEDDVKEALGCLDAGGGLDGVYLSFYKDHDIGSDGIWDIWRLEGPTFVWHFRGAPHVHAYVNIAGKKA